jgi:transcriptional activator SPT7
VLHTLFENGTKKISELESYIRDDVEQYGKKVEVLKGKMEETFLKAVDVSLLPFCAIISFVLSG